jgi:hypothetical protein
MEIDNFIAEICKHKQHKFYIRTIQNFHPILNIEYK